ncbi:MAG: ABC transporter substrate-binding protein [Proteobacteria bacterium]|nr:ABC transporter substrate-binding protein [Pseudomonadota bacterium]MBU1744684.1 ABC transporter substrate-binding protein [Pseudomonadota bacterium]MBU1965505.1 ABC transporter substrate-binding protein [Pseudomonadota bacterium]
MRRHLVKFLTVLLVVFFAFSGVASAAEVVLYSSNPSELLDLVSKGFETKTGIKVSTVRMGTGEAMKRIAAEKDRPLSDVFWSGDVAVLENAKENFQSYKSPEAKALPAGYVEKENRWTASNAHVMIIMVNKSLVKATEMPKSWKDLFDPKWKGKIVMANPEKSGSAYAQAYGIHKLYGWDGINKLIANAKILDSSSLIYKGVAAGEYPLGVTMEYAAHRYIVGGDKNVGIIYPADGAFMAPEAAGIVKNCPHPEEAKKFVDYLLSKKVVDEIFHKFSRRPARLDAGDTEGLPSLKKITILKSFDPLEANTLQKEILGRWKEIVLSK